MNETGLICVGALLGAFGVKGELRLKSFCATPEDIANYNPLTDETGQRVFQIKITRPIKGGFAVRVKDIRFKDEADALRGTALFARRDKLPKLPDDEFYHSDLIGLDVLDTGGAVMGTVASVLDHGAGDILEINGPGLKSSVMLPFTQAAVPTVDLQLGRIIVDPPPDLFPKSKA